MKIINSTSPTTVRRNLHIEGKKTSIASIEPLNSSSLHSFDSTISNDSSTTSSSLSSSTSRKGVRFSPIVRVKDTISRHDMTEDEITRSFLQQDEFEYIWEHTAKLLRRAKHYHSGGKPLRSYSKCLKGFESDIEKTEKGNYLCTRGLEGSARSYQRTAIEQVLEEQELQILEGFYDDELIAEVYIEYNVRATFKAVYMAMEDRLTASYFVMEDKISASKQE